MTHPLFQVVSKNASSGGFRTLGGVISCNANADSAKRLPICISRSLAYIATNYNPFLFLDILRYSERYNSINRPILIYAEYLGLTLTVITKMEEVFPQATAVESRGNSNTSAKGFDGSNNNSGRSTTKIS